MDFSPNYKVISKIEGSASIEELSEEVGVYSATPDFVRRTCGPIACTMLDSIPDSWFKEARDKKLWPNFDVRVHRLYPGDFPAYPGWHCDGQYRETYFTQPKTDHVMCGRHIIGYVSSIEGVSRTEFLSQKHSLTLDSIPSQQETLWGMLDKSIESLDEYDSWELPEGNLVLFDSSTPHRATPSKKRGWRLFFRASMWYRENLGEGKVSRQEHIYKLVEGSGW